MMDSSNAGDADEFNPPQQELPEEAVSLTGQKPDVSSSWEGEFGLAQGKLLKSFTVFFSCLVCAKVAQVATNPRLSFEELLANVAVNATVLIFWCCFHILTNAHRRLLRYSSLIGLGVCNVYIVYLTVCDEHYQSLLFQSQVEDAAASNDIFVILTFAILFVVFGIPSKAVLLDCLVLACVNTGLALICQSPWNELSIKLVLFLFIFLHYTPQSAKKTSTTWKYQVYTEQNSHDLASGNIEQALRNCDLIAESIQQVENLHGSTKFHKPLQAALRQLKKVKRQIASGPDTDFIPEENMDDEERAFCLEHYTNFAQNLGRQATQRPHSTHTLTLIQVMERDSGQFSSGDIGGLLNGLGRMWNFDVMLVQDTMGKCIQPTAEHLLSSWKLSSEFKISPKTASAYFGALESQYLQNPYHNAAHAVDVLHSLLYFMARSSLVQEATLLEILSLCIAALGHDVGHPAVNNKYLVMTKDNLAVRYNDTSVLENMHASVTFELMNEPERNILQWLNEEELLEARKMIIEMILGTDMSKHFETYNRFAAKLATQSMSLANREERTFVFSVGLKCADIGHSAKALPLHTRWSAKICEEFFAQGDLEKARGLPVSAGFNRATANVAKSQAGFLKYICLPLYEAWADFLASPEIDKNCVQQLRDNIQHWESSDFQRTNTLVTSSPSKLTKQNTMRF